MFTPSQHDVRRFFCEAYRKFLAKEILTPIEVIASDWIQEHPEYHQDLSDIEVALAADYSVENGQTNPFLHLSMHLSISEQISVDQPRGVQRIFQQLRNQHNSTHAAQHEMMECLGEMIWQSQRSGLPPDGVAYIQSLNKRIK
jgi:hypothetical protein